MWRLCREATRSYLGNRRRSRRSPAAGSPEGERSEANPVAERRGKSAEVVIAENKPGATGPCKLETGNLEAVKDRTDEEPLTAWRTSKSIPPDRAGARVRAVTMGAESSRQPIRRIARRAGGARQQCRALGRSGMRRKAEVTVSGKEETPTLAGTARYGPVRRVVWDPWLTNTQSRGPDSHFCFSK